MVAEVNKNADDEDLTQNNDKLEIKHYSARLGTKEDLECSTVLQ